jgi:hypothetical protein
LSELYAVRPNQLDGLWPRILPLLQKVADRNPRLDSLDDIKAGIRNRTYQLYVAGTEIEMALVTQIKTERTGKRCVLFMCGGEHRENWIHNLKALEQTAKANGCTTMSIQGRRVWERVLPEYKVESVTLEKTL